MSKTNRPGFYMDAAGNWQPDRRKGGDRRTSAGGGMRHEQRKYYRRKADIELYEKDHKTMIKEALDEFAEEHENQV